MTARYVMQRKKYGVVPTPETGAPRHIRAESVRRHVRNVVWNDVVLELFLGHGRQHLVLA